MKLPGIKNAVSQRGKNAFQVIPLERKWMRNRDKCINGQLTMGQQMAEATHLWIANFGLQLKLALF